MNSNRIELLTPLTPEECASRLMAVIDTERSALFSFAALFGTRPVIGRVTDSSLRLRKRIGYRNSFQSFLTATMRREAEGTVISGEVAMHPFVRIFMIIWFSGVILIGGTIFLVTIGSLISHSAHQQQNAWVGAVIFPAMLVFGYGLIQFGRYLARGEAPFLEDFLIQTLGAHKHNRAA